MNNTSPPLCKHDENHAIRVEFEEYVLKELYKDRVRTYLKLPLQILPFMLGV